MTGATAGTATTTPAPRAHWATHGCTHGHPSKVAYKRVTQIMRSKKRLTKRRARKARHYVVCVATTAKSRAVRKHARKQLRWRRSYEGYWRIRKERVPRGQLAFMMAVHQCESVNWYLNGHHDGGFQYDERTWWEAQDLWTRPPRRYRRSPAYNASRDHQIAVTAVFMPSNLGRWTASRHCWG